MTSRSAHVLTFPLKVGRKSLALSVMVNAWPSTGVTIKVPAHNSLAIVTFIISTPGKVGGVIFEVQHLKVIGHSRSLQCGEDHLLLSTLSNPLHPMISLLFQSV